MFLLSLQASEMIISEKKEPNGFEMKIEQADTLADVSV